MKKLLALTLLISPFFTSAQEGDFQFGRILHSELGMTTYALDTSASAVVLKEFGRAYFNDNVNIVFEHHLKIKILKKQGLDESNFQITLHKDGNLADRDEKWISLEASTFNYQDNKIVETKFDTKNFFLENSDHYYSTAKFALPDVRVGSVLEVKYVTESPYIFNFKTWHFQSDIPKVRSEFWASLPANFTYSVRLNGFLKLNSSNVDLVRECFRMPGASGGGYASNRSDCSLGKYVMENIPSFKEEGYISSRKNFLSAIYYELSEVDQNGVRTKYSEEWKDVDQKLKENEDFGQKIRKAKKLMDEIIQGLMGTLGDDLKKANAIFEYIQHWYDWNGDNAKYASQEPRKSYDSKKGNSADINLALVAALQVAHLNADPVILSTRDNGFPSKLHPQRADFNYVISSLKIGDQLYLLDATDPLLPFGVLPIRCLNDQGRLVSKDESSWVDLKPTQKFKSSVAMELKLDDKGGLKGKLTHQHVGYSAYEQRRDIHKNKDQEEYEKSLSKELGNAIIENYQVENKEDLSKPLIEKMDIEISELDNTGANIIYFNPFLTERFEKNPFKSNERLYPVDLGAPIETSYFISIELPEKYKVDEAPTNVAIGLPQNGGKCLLNVAQIGNKVTLSSIFSLTKPIYTPEEYHSLKEFFARIVQMQQSQFVFKLK